MPYCGGDQYAATLSPAGVTSTAAPDVSPVCDPSNPNEVGGVTMMVKSPLSGCCLESPEATPGKVRYHRTRPLESNTKMMAVSGVKIGDTTVYPPLGAPTYVSDAPCTNGGNAAVVTWHVSLETCPYPL